MAACKRTRYLRNLALGEPARCAQPDARLWRNGGYRLRRGLGEQQQVAYLETVPRHAKPMTLISFHAKRRDHFLTVARHAGNLGKTTKVVFAEATERIVAEVVVHQVKERTSRACNGGAFRREVLSEALFARA